MASKSAKQPANEDTGAQAGQAVAVQEQAGLPANFMAELEANAKLGMKNVTADDMTIPFLGIVQSNSPQVVKGQPEYNPDTRSSMIFNNASGQFWDGDAGVDFIPVAYQRVYNEWIPRNDGGGFVATHYDDSILEKTKKGGKNGNSDVLENGHEIVNTANWFGYTVDKKTGEITQAVISFTSTQLKKSRKLMTQLQQFTLAGASGSRFTPPPFYHVLHLTTVPESNDQGNWFGWKIELAGTIQDLPNGGYIMKEATTFAKMVEERKVSAAAGPKPAAEDGPIPF